MKVTASPYLTEHKPLFRRLLQMLLEEYPYASLLASDIREKSWSASRRLTSISGSGQFSARGFVVRVFDGAHWSEHSFSRISQDLLPELFAQIKETAALSPLPAGVAENAYAAPVEEETVFRGSTDCEVLPEDLGDDEIIARLTALRDRGLARSGQLLDCTVRANWNRTSKLFLSPKKDLEQNIMWTVARVSAAAGRGQEIKTSHEAISHLGGLELLDKLGERVARVAGTTVELLDSEPLVPGEYECICTPDTTGMIVHEAFGHGVEMDMFVKDRAQARRFIGQYVASPLVTMHDGAAAAPETGSYFFDDEGTMARDTVVIEKGVLKTGISDYQSAMLLGTQPTGNGRRESHRRKAYARMTNTFFEGGTDRVEDMIASVKDGLLLAEPASGMEDPKNWGIQCMVNYAREIKDGKLTGRIFSPIVLTGYVPDLLKSITMMSPDVEMYGAGFCGKGYKEWLKVSEGGPYIKARIRLG